MSRDLCEISELDQSQSNWKQPSIVLVQPYLDMNVGSVARVMMNFGLSDLRIVRPRCDPLSEPAMSNACAAVPILENAKIYDNVRDAIRDNDHVVACTARRRTLEDIPVIFPSQLRYLLSDVRAVRNFEEKHLVDTKHVMKLGLLFGAERSGLTNEEVAHAEYILNIPSFPGDNSPILGLLTLIPLGFGVLNLSHAVAIVGYELWQFREERARRPSYPQVQEQEQEQEQEQVPRGARHATRLEVVHAMDRREQQHAIMACDRLTLIGRIDARILQEKRKFNANSLRRVMLRGYVTEKELSYFHSILTRMFEG
ncbi:hypothetical protein GUITHDRAFT_131692 [Guillardia theta CCMP2712]|uniref:tRNA/rRNA methyltransferase SpoU type domain-containing protein n=1 Tax=Guillardia theta (strain CCMP2712) TaxID=905079 RepID=L1K4J4_GUITC|nr:hypothetical protein GUITHDRAFT_131692 [Guillardia theta CCMP2712]EKX55512.1 hypothetical protein GUITHDRAFT_131692 [Guillardia theta CCMP2712]|eukprot:XP_005842492.1 hypothetical protein GUITHDRAFT_131692 [Guillardia theta CCMP2712]